MYAHAEHAELVAYQRPAPIIVRGDEVVWPGGWIHDLEGHTLTPTTPGQAVGHIAVSGGQAQRWSFLALKLPSLPATLSA